VLLAGLLCGWLVGLRYPFFPERGERLMLLALPAFVLLAASGLDALWGRSQPAFYSSAAAIAVFCGASLHGFYTVPRYPSDDYRPLIARSVEQGLPGDTVFCVFPWQVGYWRSYGSPNGPMAELSPDATWGPKVSAALDAALAEGRIWFPAHLALGGVLEGSIESHLAGAAVPFANEWFGAGTRLSAWSPGKAGQAVPAPVARFLPTGKGGEAITLQGVSTAGVKVAAANSVLPISLEWRAEARPPVLGVSVRMVDALGQIWAQHDYEPLGGEHPEGSGPYTPSDSVGLLIPAGTPPGRYGVEIAVMAQGGMSPLEVEAEDGQLAGHTVRLFDVTVTPAVEALGVERLPIATRRPLRLQDGLRYLGDASPESPANPGELRKMNLFWEAVAQPARDYAAFIQLLDGRGNVVAGWQAAPGAAYATSQWAPGTLMRTQASLRIPANLHDGRYQLIAGLFDPATGTRLRTMAGADRIDLGRVPVQGREHSLTPPRPARAADARFGEEARLAGYDLAQPDGGTTPGSTLPLTLYWEALATPDRAYTAFVHLLDASGAIVGYGDSEPGKGKYPTTGWLPGEYLADRHKVTVSLGIAAGAYRLAVGLYDPSSGERLLLPDGADQQILDLPVVISSK